MDIAIQYANDVVNKKISACKYTIKACKRFLNDIKKSKSDEYEWYYDEEEAQKIIDFGNCLTIVEDGKVVPIELKPFQCFILANINGWRHKEKGYRRFKYSFLTMSRKNGKSILNAILVLFYGNFYPSMYSQIYLVGVKLQSAKIVFNECCRFIESDDDLNEVFDIKDYKSEIKCLNTNSTIKALGKSTDIDGFLPFLGIVDEYHLHPTNQLYKLLSDGMKSMNDSLISVITTSGFDTNRPCYQEYNYCKNLLDKVVTNERYFTCIWEVDEDVDLFSRLAIEQSNPLLRDFETQIEDIINEGNKAKIMQGTELVNFMVKTMNRWTSNADAKYLQIEQINKCKSNKTLNDFKGKKITVGFDLSQANDLTTIGIVIKYKKGNKTKHFIHQHSFIPKAKLLELEERAIQIPYRLWSEKGLLTITEGLRTDYKFILKYLRDLIKKYNFTIDSIGFDPYNANIFLDDLGTICPNLVKVVQSCKSLSSATEDFRLNILEENVEFNREDELLIWTLNNAYLVRNSFDEVKIDKKSNGEKIDAVDAIIDAWKVIYTQNKNDNINVNDSLNTYFKKMGF